MEGFIASLGMTGLGFFRSGLSGDDVEDHDLGALDDGFL